MNKFEEDYLKDSDFGEEEYNFQANPRYNIQKMSFNAYEIVMEVAGYSKSDIDIVMNEGVLKVTGIPKKHKISSRDFIHRGYKIVPFKNKFAITNRLEVISESLKEGLLTINLKDKTSYKEAISPIE